MRNRLEQIEETKRRDNAIIKDDGVYSISFLLKDLLQKDSLSLSKERLRKTKTNDKTKTKNNPFRSIARNNVRSLTRKETHSHSKSRKNVNKQIRNDESLAKRMQQINNNYEMAIRLQRQE